MEPELLQFIIIFAVGLFSGMLIMLLWNKLSSGSASPSSVKQDYDEYKTQVESHFEETSKKFQDMTEQYQDLYKHLAVGATSLCRPDSVAATLANDTGDKLKLEKKSAAQAEIAPKAESAENAEKTDEVDKVAQRAAAEEKVKKALEKEAQEQQAANAAPDNQVDDAGAAAVPAKETSATARDYAILWLVGLPPSK